MRLRLVDGRRLNPESLMPSYYRVEGLTRVARQYAGKPALTAQEIEDVLAYLMTLVRRDRKGEGDDARPDRNFAPRDARGGGRHPRAAAVGERGAATPESMAAAMDEAPARARRSRPAA